MMDSTMEPINVKRWLVKHEKDFLPPVCNKMLHDQQLKVFFVGGPNVREDYHINEGEEFFYMLKGDMCLKTIEQGEKRDVHIRQGECFLLPSKIPHSPQRKGNTIGLVIERERLKNERDGLRFYVKGTTQPLWERWFYCENLGTQLVPLIQEYFDSFEHKSQTPTNYSLPGKAPYQVDERTVTDPAVDTEQFLAKNSNKLRQGGKVSMFPNGKTAVEWIGSGQFSVGCDEVETFIWQWRGSATVTINQNREKLIQNSCLVVPKGAEILMDNGSDSLTLSVQMPPPMN